MKSMLVGLFPLLVIATWVAGFVLAECAWRHRSLATLTLAAVLCVTFSLAAIATLAWIAPQLGQDWSDAPLEHIESRSSSQSADVGHASAEHNPSRFELRLQH
jgi:hypothetical protein